MNDDIDSRVGDGTHDVAADKMQGFAGGAAGQAQSHSGGSVDGVASPDSSVDEMVNRLGDLDSTDVSEHPAIYEDIHRTLAAALDDPPTTEHAQ